MGGWLLPPPLQPPPAQPCSVSRKPPTPRLPACPPAVRLNMSHGSHESHAKVVDLVKEYNASGRGCLAILLDTKGPEVRPAAGAAAGAHAVLACMHAPSGHLCAAASGAASMLARLRQPACPCLRPKLTPAPAAPGAERRRGGAAGAGGGRPPDVHHGGGRRRQRQPRAGCAGLVGARAHAGPQQGPQRGRGGLGTACERPRSTGLELAGCCPLNALARPLLNLLGPHPSHASFLISHSLQ